jgi:hypothetical protein
VTRGARGAMDRESTPARANMAEDCDETARRAREVAARIERELAEDLARPRARVFGETGTAA